MAKVKAPLFGFEARGAIGRTLVYFPWKGIPCVREYVIPTNPRSTLQTSQRNKLKAAVDEFHSAGYNTLDMGAWTRRAGLLPKTMTGFNAMCKVHIDEAVAGNTWESIAKCVITGILATQFTVEVTKASAGNAPKLYIGTRATYMPTEFTLVDQTGDKWEVDVINLTAGTDYYFYVDVGASGTDYGRIGVYKQRTAAS